MLAPLKDRSVLEREPSAEIAEIGTVDAEMLALRLALREARRTQRRSATLSARKTVELTNQLHRLTELNARLTARVDELENGQAVIALGQQLMALRHENDALHDAVHRLWFLDRTLCAAHRECERLARERDAALDSLQKQRTRPSA
jgi:predicted RNase H-like nuclease (RuvC/YqgF family)